MTPALLADLATITRLAALPTRDPNPPIEEVTVEIISVERNGT